MNRSQLNHAVPGGRNRSSVHDFALEIDKLVVRVAEQLMPDFADRDVETAARCRQDAIALLIAVNRVDVDTPVQATAAGSDRLPCGTRALIERALRERQAVKAV